MTASVPRRSPGPHAMIALHNQVEAAEAGFTRPPMAAHLQPLLEKYRALYMTYQPPDARYLTNHRGHLMFVKPEEAHLCTAELIQATTFTGTKAGAARATPRATRRRLRSLLHHHPPRPSRDAGGMDRGVRGHVISTAPASGRGVDLMAAARRATSRRRWRMPLSSAASSSSADRQGRSASRRRGSHRCR